MNGKIQGFSGNPKLEFLLEPHKTNYSTIEKYRRVYHLVEIPEKYYDLKGRWAILEENLTYIDTRGRRHTAVAGTLTNGGSLPKRLWGVLSPPFASKFLQAYIIHDSICGKAEDIPDRKMRKELRKSADKLFLEMIKYCGAGRIKQFLFYRGVRIGSLWV
jgi:hypothetical protein